MQAGARLRQNKRKKHENEAVLWSTEQTQERNDPPTKMTVHFGLVKTSSRTTTATTTRKKKKTAVSRTFNHTYNCAHEQKKTPYTDFPIKQKEENSMSYLTKKKRRA